jgi:phenylalanyl-tRNA synthetase beta chain
MASLLGVEIPASVAAARLRLLGAKVTRAGRRALAVAPPSFRSDLNEPSDLAEEVARLTGLEEIPAVSPARRFAYAAPNHEREFIRGTREVMLGCGLWEANTIAFVAPADNERFPGLTRATPVSVENPLSAELSQVRLSLIPGLLAALRFNLNREASAIHVFELAKVFAMRDGRASESQRFAALSFGDLVRASIGEKSVAPGFFTLKGVLENYFDALGITDRVAFEPIEAGSAAFLHPARAAKITLDEHALGFVGELHPSEALRIELDGPCALCELDLTILIAYGFSPRKAVEPPPRFPSVRRDLALVLDRDFPVDKIVRAIRDVAPVLLESVDVFDVYEGAPIAPGRKSVALALRYRSRERTLTDEEVNRAHAQLTEEARMRLGAELRQ